MVVFASVNKYLSPYDDNSIDNGVLLAVRKGTASETVSNRLFFVFL